MSPAAPTGPVVPKSPAVPTALDGPPARVVVEADGGSRGNPGPAGYGAVVLDPDTGATLAERQDFLGVATNNVAEYQGLIAGLTAAAELGARQVRVRMDSKLVVEQMSGRWQVKHPAMRPLARQAGQLVSGFDSVSFEWIPRAQNSHADRLANQAMDAGRDGAATGSQPGWQLDPPSETSAPVAPPSPPEQLLLEPQPANNNSAWLPPDTRPTRFILVRHGVTAYSVDKRFAGRSDLELTADGLRQARRAAARIAELAPVDALVCSPLRRTRQTGQPIAESLGLEPTVDEGLIEADFGDWDGHTFAEVDRRWPGELGRWMADSTLAPPGGESLDQVTRRVRRARDRIVAANLGRTVVLVSHVTPIKTLVRLALDAPAGAVHRMFLSPASISIIDYYTDGPVSLKSFNDTVHLDKR